MEEKMKQLIEELVKYADTYYMGRPDISDKEYDRLYDELVELEKETGIIYPDSPTQTVGSKAVGTRKKVRHEYPALSLEKTKDIGDIIKVFAKAEEEITSGCRGMGEILMWKLDGSTVQLTYDDGQLILAATRGNGEIGLDITDNASYIKGIPMAIDHRGKLTVRGEAVMSYREFDRVNASLPANEEQYTHPRNLATATLTLPAEQKFRGREICFFAFDLVHIEDGPDETPEKFPWPYGPGAPGKFLDSFEERLLWLQEQGFQTVPYAGVTTYNMEMIAKRWGDQPEVFEYPVDGLVIAHEARKYATAQPGTAHNPNVLCGYALKWQDETVQTRLRKIEWSASRTGLLNPVAIFDPVDLEGATLTRATLHNVSYIEQKNLCEGDVITVYRANKVIPAVDRNLSAGSHKQIVVRDLTCPCCKKKASVKRSEDSDTVLAVCENPECAAKRLGLFVHFCERDCMNIYGLSEKKLEFLINHGYIRELYDIYEMKGHGHGAGVESLDTFFGVGEQRHILEDEPGWEMKSVDNLLAAIEESRKTDFVSFVHALGIPNFGKGQAKAVYGYYRMNEEDKGRDYTVNFFDDLKNGNDFRFIRGFGDKIQNSLEKWADDNLDGDIFRVWDHLIFPKTKKREFGSLPLRGMSFVITGKLGGYKNREEMQSFIETLGGSCRSSVTGNTDYLISNDAGSMSSKNKKAKELGVPVITEEEFECLPGVQKYKKEYIL